MPEWNETLKSHFINEVIPDEILVRTKCYERILFIYHK